jgi:membrane protein DedA with SNARE-associated domain
MLHWIARLVGSMNYPGVALLMAIENVVLPLPSELIMPLAGFQTTTGRMTLLGVTVFGTAGSVLGALPLFYAGGLLGEERVKHWIDRHGRWLFIRRRDLDRASGRLRGNHFVAVTLAQLLPGVRGLISIPAGIARMNVFLFLLAKLIGTLVWCAALAVGGRVLGAHFTQIYKVLAPLGLILIGALLAARVTWVFRRRNRRMRTA